MTKKNRLISFFLIFVILLLPMASYGAEGQSMALDPEQEVLDKDLEDLEPGPLSEVEEQEDPGEAGEPELVEEAEEDEEKEAVEPEETEEPEDVEEAEEEELPEEPVEPEEEEEIPEKDQEAEEPEEEDEEDEESYSPFDIFLERSPDQKEVESMLALIRKQSFPVYQDPLRVEIYIRHFLNSMKDYEKVMNKDSQPGFSAKDSRFSTNLRGGGWGCWHYALFLSQTIYDSSQGFDYDNNEIVKHWSQEGFSGQELKDFLLEQAQAGEHLRLDESHSLIYVSGNDEGFYTLQYFGDSRDPFLSFMSYDFFAQTLNSYKKNLILYNYNEEINQPGKEQELYHLAVRTSKYNFEESKELVLVSDKNFPDAIGGNILASHLEVPLLVTKTDEIPELVLEEIERLEAEKIYLLGGEDVLGKELVEKLEDLDLEIERLDAPDRYVTAGEVAKRLDEDLDHVFLVSGQNHADALIAAPVAIDRGDALLMTNPQELSQGTRESLEELEIQKVTIIGALKAVSQEVEDELIEMGLEVERVSGKDRYETSLGVAQEFYDNEKVAESALARGSDYFNSWQASQRAAGQSSPLLLVEEEDMDGAILDYLADIRQEAL